MGYRFMCLFLFIFLGSSILEAKTIVLDIPTPPEISETVAKSNAKIKKIFKKLNIDVKFEHLQSLRGLIESNAGNLDGEAQRIYELKADGKYPNLIRVNEHHHEAPHSIFVRDKKIFENFDRSNPWKSLQKYHVVIKRGIKVCENGVAKYPPRQVTRLGTINQLMNFISVGRGDVGIAATGNAKSLEKLIGEKVYMSDEPIYGIKLYIYLHKKHADLVPQVEKVIREMKAAGTLDP